MRLPITICILSISTLLSLQECRAQNVFKDFFSGPVQYSPSDPWTKGKVFNYQTGHAGLFSDCDDEECKRYSPYICWKMQHKSPAPLRRGLLRGMVIDVNAVKQRIRDGAGECCGQPGCTCHQCRQHASDCGCQVCRLGDDPAVYLSESTKPSPQTQMLARPTGEQVPATYAERAKLVVPGQSRTVTRTEELVEIQRESLTQSVKKKYGLLNTPTLSYDQTVKEIESRLTQQQKSDAKTRVADAIDALQRRR